ncbi:MAG: lysozyme inhibitor LprI family protein [Burkholderiales bacterium]
MKNSTASAPSTTPAFTHGRWAREVSLLWVLAAACGTVQAAAGGPPACQDAQTTQAIVECSAVETKAWDQRLNKAYDALKKRIDPGQTTPLLDAQRLWIRYRDANCKFYAMSEGTIGRVEAADCMRRTTRQRACELEVTHDAQAEVAADCQ